MLEVRRARPARPGRNGRQETRNRARSPPHLSAAPAAQVSCPAVTPAPVLAASGHVQRFTDLMVRDEASGECHRADKLLAELCGARTPDATVGLGAGELARLAADAGEMGAEELGAALTRLSARAPGSGGELSAPFSFNLMFRSAIGPAGDTPAFLRPETAQARRPSPPLLEERNHPGGIASAGCCWTGALRARPCPVSTGRGTRRVQLVRGGGEGAAPSQRTLRRAPSGPRGLCFRAGCGSRGPPRPSSGRTGGRRRRRRGQRGRLGRRVTPASRRGSLQTSDGCSTSTAGGSRLLPRRCGPARPTPKPKPPLKPEITQTPYEP
jgi:hypothetical protein